MWLFLTIGPVNKHIKTNKRKFADNHFHNVLRLLDVLPNYPFTTNETMRNYYL